MWRIGSRRYRKQLLKDIVNAQAAINELQFALKRDLREEDQQQFDQAMKDCNDLEKIELQRVRQLFAMSLQDLNKAEELLIDDRGQPN